MEQAVIILSVCCFFFLALLRLVYFNLAQWQIECFTIHRQYAKQSTEHKKNLQKIVLSTIERYVSDYFQDDPVIKEHITKINADDFVTIRIGSDEKMVSVDMDLFSLDAQRALEDAKSLYISEF